MQDVQSPVSRALEIGSELQFFPAWWGRTPGLRPTPPSARWRRNELKPRADGGTRASRADRGVCPTIFAGFAILGKLNDIGFSAGSTKT
jgi:hypothetical protein